MRYEKGRKVESGGRADGKEKSSSKPEQQRDVAEGRRSVAKTRPPTVMELLMDRASRAENMCKDLIRIIAVDDGEFLASHAYDYLAAGEAIKRGEI